jgi:hypothetical protein
MTASVQAMNTAALLDAWKEPALLALTASYSGELTAIMINAKQTVETAIMTLFWEQKTALY